MCCYKSIRNIQITYYLQECFYYGTHEVPTCLVGLELKDAQPYGIPRNYSSAKVVLPVNGIM